MRRGPERPKARGDSRGLGLEKRREKQREKLASLFLWTVLWVPRGCLIDLGAGMVINGR